MATQYLVFQTLPLAQTASETDWSQRVLHHPTLSTADTKYSWGIISNAAGTIGVISDNVPHSWLSAIEIVNLVDATDPTVAAVLAAQPEPPI